MDIKIKTNGCSGANAHGLYANTVAHRSEIYASGVSKMLIWFHWKQQEITNLNRKIQLRIKDWIKTSQKRPTREQYFLKPNLVFRERN